MLFCGPADVSSGIKAPCEGLGWSEDEKLLVVTEDGTVRCYYDLQGDFTQFSLGNVRSDLSQTMVRCG